MHKAAILSLSLLVVASVASNETYHHHIYVNPTAGNDTKECHTSNSTHLPCKTLNHAFEYRNDSTQYILSPDSTLVLDRNVSVFENLQMLALVGSNSTIACGERIGLAFVNVSNISFTDITLLYCSALRNSTSKNFFASTFSLYQFNVGLYFYLCEDVSMTRVSVNSSQNATGVVMYDTVGRNVIQDSVFANNSVKEGVPGGGGLYVEFSYCIPGDNQCNDADNKTSNHNAFYSFDSCTFTNNVASNKGTGDNSTYIVPYRSNHQAFGRGGGLSIFVKGTASNNLFEITNCHFVGNSAQWGGGLFLELHDETSNNSMFVTDCVFMYNALNYTLDTGTGGGGLRIGHYVYNYNWDLPESGNRIEVRYSNFSSNLAMYGGGVSISPTLQDTDIGNEAIVRLVGVVFYGNTGKIGAALHIGLFQLVTLGINIDLMIQDCIFCNNHAQFADVLNKTNVPHTIGIGSVYITQVPTTFQGDILFCNNSGSALAVAGSPVDFTRSHTFFYNNSGYRGGAICLLGATYILVNNETTLEFNNNLATDRGGAIYNKYIEMDNLMTRSNCFIRHAIPSIKPDDWEASFIFFDNMDLNGNHSNSIHTSSVLPCAWAGGNGYIVNKNKIFCWQGWEYYDVNHLHMDNCSEQITSEAGHMMLKQDPQDTMRVIPGREFLLPLNITDDFWNDLVKETVFSSTSSARENRVSYFWGGKATLSGAEGTRIQLKLDSLGDRIWHVNLETELLPCPPGQEPTVVNDNETVCACHDNYMYRGIVLCDPDLLRARINANNWIGKLPDSDEYLVGACPPAYCNIKNDSYLIPDSGDKLSDFICDNNRTGVVCGECLKGHGPAVNSVKYECVNCTDNLAVEIAKYVASIYLPLGILFTVLIVFDIRLTTGPANAFILYAQVVSSTLSVDADGQIPLYRLIRSYNPLLKAYKVIYGIFNLEFLENLLPPFCFSSDFNTLTALSLDYGVAFFPLVMIAIVVICLKLSECLSCGVRSHAQPTTRCAAWKRRTSEALLPAFAAFLLLSYTKFSLTSSHMMSIQRLVRVDGNEVAPPRVYYASQYSTSDNSYRYGYLLPSSIIFVIFVCITPLLLLSYPLRGLEWCLSKVRCLWRLYPVVRIHVFLDTFQGCYRNNMRFFAGLYFLFRLTISLAYIFADSWLQEFLVQQIACMIMAVTVASCRPYVKEKNIFNYVDTFIFTNLAVINSLSFYLYTTSLNGQAPPLSAFIFQYALLFLPLLYMVTYILWYLATCRNQWLKKKLSHLLKPGSEQNYTPINARGGGARNRTFTQSEVAVDDAHVGDDDDEEEEEEALLARAQDTNRYRQVNHQGSGTDMAAYDSMVPPSTGQPSGEASGSGEDGKTNLSAISTRDPTFSLSYQRVVSNGYGTMSSSSTNPSVFCSGHTHQSQSEDEGI